MDRRNTWEDWESMEIGTPNSLNYRKIFIDSQGREVSIWRDIPLFAEGKLFRSVCKTPKASTSTHHVETAEDDPSLKSALRKGIVCSYVIPAPWNIGMLPQTWADPNQANTGVFKGLINDGQPIEVIEISNISCYVGKVSVVKPLGMFALMGDTHVSLHVIAIDIEDPNSRLLSGPHDVEDRFPGILSDIRDWLQTRFGDHDERAVLLEQTRQEDAMEEVYDLIHKSHSLWKLFSAMQMEWRQRSAEILNYGKSVWENYVVHDSKATRRSNDPLSKSGELYDLAWACLDYENHYECSYEPSYSSRDYSSTRDWELQKGKSKRGDLISLFFKGRSSSKVSSENYLSRLEEKSSSKNSNGCFPFSGIIKKEKKSKVFI